MAKHSIKPDKWSRFFYILWSVSFAIMSTIAHEAWIIPVLIGAGVYLSLEFAFDEGVKASFRTMRDLLNPNKEND